MIIIITIVHLKEGITMTENDNLRELAINALFEERSQTKTSTTAKAFNKAKVQKDLETLLVKYGYDTHSGAIVSLMSLFLDNLSRC